MKYLKNILTFLGLISSSLLSGQECCCCEDQNYSTEPAITEEHEYGFYLHGDGNEINWGLGPRCDKLYGIWFPDEPPLMKPFMADPRQINFSVGWRFHDQVIHKKVIDVSFGDYLPMYEWFNVWPYNGRVLFEIVGAVWAVFSPCQELSPLVNADYYGGGQLTYAHSSWALRLRIFHISSHIGDEFLIMHPHFKRLNPSAEYVDVFISDYITDDIRLYAGIGWIAIQDDSFKCKPFYAEGGMEVRLRDVFGIDWCNMLYGTPFYAMHFRYNGEFKRHVDATYVLGYEWGQVYGSYRKIRVYVEYHDGYSLEGQFCKFPTNYLSFRTSYSY